VNVPRTRADYSPDGLLLVQATCLDLATCVGDYWEELVIVGGFVPTLLVAPETDIEQHVGTLDLDLGLSLGLLKGERYADIAARLRRAGYEPDIKENGQPAHHRWKLAGHGAAATVDFLIQNPGGERAGTPLHLSKEFAPIRIDVLEAAFADRIPVKLEGRTARGDRAARTVQVCGPAAYVILKTRAFEVRGLPKDAYDLFYVIRNYGAKGPEGAAARWPLVAALPSAASTLDTLRAQATATDHPIPRRVAEFLEEEGDEVPRDVVGFVRRFLEIVS